MTTSSKKEPHMSNPQVLLTGCCFYPLFFTLKIHPLFAILDPSDTGAAQCSQLPPAQLPASASTSVGSESDSTWLNPLGVELSVSIQRCSWTFRNDTVNFWNKMERVWNIKFSGVSLMVQCTLNDNPPEISWNISPNLWPIADGFHWLVRVFQYSHLQYDI